MGDVAARPDRVVGLGDRPAQAVQHVIDVEHGDVDVLDVEHQHMQQIVDRTTDRDQHAIHIGFADGEPRVQHQPANRFRCGDPHGGGRLTAIAVEAFRAIWPDHPQPADLDALPEDPVHECRVEPSHVLLRR